MCTLHVKDDTSLFILIDKCVNKKCHQIWVEINMLEFNARFSWIYFYFVYFAWKKFEILKIKYNKKFLEKFCRSKLYLHSAELFSFMIQNPLWFITQMYVTPRSFYQDIICKQYSCLHWKAAWFSFFMEFETRMLCLRLRNYTSLSKFINFLWLNILLKQIKCSYLK